MNRNLVAAVLAGIVLGIICLFIGSLIVGPAVMVVDQPVDHNVVIGSRVTVSSLDNTIVTSSLELVGVEASIDPAHMEKYGWSEGEVVSSGERLHRIGDKVVVVPTSDGGYSIVYQESISAIFGFTKIGIQVVSQVLEALDSP
jgi:hypothetical protein